MSASAKTVAVAEAKAAPAKVTPARVPALMRKCACEGAGPACGKCSDDESKKKLQRKASGSAAAPVAIPPAVNNVLSGPGRPLDSGTRGFMESRFGHDFGNVRVHTGGDAADSARAVGAHAYTVGNDIVFDHGRYDPQSESGRHLLAHELTHTIQQRGIGRMANESLGETSAGDAYESEADSIASRVLSGGGAITPHAHAHAPMIARTSVTGSAQPQPATVASKLAAAKLKEVADPGVDPGETRKFIVEEPFPLPGEKGPFAHKLWQERTQNNALVAMLDPRTGDQSPKASLKQATPPTDEKRAFWFQKVGWTDTSQWTALTKSTAYPSGESFPKAGGETCDWDHIVELQIGGTNVPQNFQPLDPGPNRSSGGQVRGILAEKATQVRDIYPGLSNVILQYTSVAEPKGAGCGPCCLVEKNVAKPAGADATTEEGDPYLISSGGFSATLRIPPKLKKNIPIFDSGSVANKAGAQIIPGLLLKTFEREGAHSFAASADDRPGTRLPITFDKTATFTFNADANGALTLATKDKTRKVAFEYPYLSKGTLTKLDVSENNLSGEGVLEPSIPLLRGLKLGIRFSLNELVITTPIPTDKLKSIPGFKIKDTSKLALELYPQFNPSGNLDFYVGSEDKPIVWGSVSIAAPSGEFTATGTLNANLPGFDSASGNVTYKRSEGWTGSLSVSSSKIPGAKSVAVTVGLSDKGYTAAGELIIALPTPKNEELTLTVRQSPNERPVYKGKTEVTVPPLKPVKLSFESDGRHLTATGATTFSLLGTNGEIDVTYKDGVITGTGSLKFAKGKASGSLTVTLTPKRKFKGEGKLSYKITDSLIAEAGAILDENEKLTLKGALEFTKPIPLFKPLGGSYKFFDVSISIPVPGASIGPIGIQAKVGASLSASYAFGPGELQNVKIEATFNPLEENVDPQLRFTGRLYIGASATISGEIYGAIALDLLVAEVAGGISLIPSATLTGSFTADAVAQYAKGDYSVDAQLAVELGLKLALALTAWVKAKAGVSIFSVETRKDWTLAKFAYDTGLKLGVKAPIHWSSKEPFKLPSADQIVFTKPDINVERMLERIFGSARSEEKEL